MKSKAQDAAERLGAPGRVFSLDVDHPPTPDRFVVYVETVSGKGMSATDQDRLIDIIAEYMVVLGYEDAVIADGVMQTRAPPGHYQIHRVNRDGSTEPLEKWLEHQKRVARVRSHLRSRKKRNAP